MFKNGVVTLTVALLSVVRCLAMRIKSICSNDKFNYAFGSYFVAANPAHKGAILFMMTGLKLIATFKYDWFSLLIVTTLKNRF
jgi:hypothetical protein